MYAVKRGRGKLRKMDRIREKVQILTLNNAAFSTSSFQPSPYLTSIVSITCMRNRYKNRVYLISCPIMVSKDLKNMEKSGNFVLLENSWKSNIGKMPRITKIFAKLFFFSDLPFWLYMIWFFFSFFFSKKFFFCFCFRRTLFKNKK